MVSRMTVRQYSCPVLTSLPSHLKALRTFVHPVQRWLPRTTRLSPWLPWLAAIDGFVVNCRLNGTVCNRTVYVIFGINMDGEKEVIGLYLGENEGAKYWLAVMTELKNRGLKDIFILCADGLKGLPEAITATFPETIFQTCVVHLVRHSLNYVPYTDKKDVALGLKKIYTADTEELAAQYLSLFFKICG